MITARIPQAISEGSPVIVADPNGYTLVGVVAMMFDGPWVTIHPTGGEQQPYSVWIPGWVGASVALDISKPTGAAHLAWWLLYQTPSRTPEQHAARLEAIGWTANGYAVTVDLAARGLGVDSAALGLMRDYAHHIVGVTP